MSQAGILSIVVLAVKRLMCKIEKVFFTNDGNLCANYWENESTILLRKGRGNTPETFVRIDTLETIKIILTVFIFLK